MNYLYTFMWMEIDENGYPSVSIYPDITDDLDTAKKEMEEQAKVDCVDTSYFYDIIDTNKETIWIYTENNDLAMVYTIIRIPVKDKKGIKIL